MHLHLRTPANVLQTIFSPGEGEETRHVADEAAAERIAADPQLTVEPRWL